MFASALSQKMWPDAGMWYRSYSARDSSSLNVLVNAYCHCSNVNPTALWRLAGFLSTGNVALTCDSGTTLTPSVGAELIATPRRRSRGRAGSA